MNNSKLLRNLPFDVITANMANRNRMFICGVQHLLKNDTIFIYTYTLSDFKIMEQ